jgi:dihydrofolate reductase
VASKTRTRTSYTRPSPPRAQRSWVAGRDLVPFVTDGVESAVEQAKAAAGDKDVHVAGGADVIQKALAAGLLEELQIHFAPLLLGGGTRLFGQGDLQRLERMRVIDSPAVTDVEYRVVKA